MIYMNSILKSLMLTKKVMCGKYFIHTLKMILQNMKKEFLLLRMVKIMITINLKNYARTKTNIINIIELNLCTFPKI